MGEGPKCPVCLLEPPDLQILDDTGDYGEQIVYNCACCGKFMMTRTASAEIGRQTGATRASLSAWLRMQTEFGKTIPNLRVRDGSLERIIANLPSYTPSQKQSILLKILAKRSEYPGQRVLFIPHFDYPLAWARNQEELVFHAKALQKQGLIDIAEESELDNGTIAISLVVTSEGLHLLEREATPDSSHGAVPWSPFPEHQLPSPRTTKTQIPTLGGRSISAIRKLLYSQSRGQIKQLMLEAGARPERILPIQVTNDMRSPNYLSKEVIISKAFDTIFDDSDKVEADEKLIRLVQLIAQRGVDVTECVVTLHEDGFPFELDVQARQNTEDPIIRKKLDSTMTDIGRAEVERGEHPHGYDVFICHAGEDKNEVAEPLANALKARNLTVWLDKFVLTIGDSLSKKIDEGLAKSRYGVVILSPSFFGKHWPEKELAGLSQKEVDGTKVILPVWHKVSRDDIAKYSLTLADKIAGTTEGGIEPLANELKEAVSR